MIKVMIVDDELIMRQGLKYMIDWPAEGFEIVAEAGNGREALELVRTFAPDIVFADVVMPQMDGVKFTHAVHEMYPETAIIILSGYDRFEYVKQTILDGAVDYILKPTLNRQILREALRKAVEKLPEERRNPEGYVDPNRLLAQLLGEAGRMDESRTNELAARLADCVCGSFGNTPAGAGYRLYAVWTGQWHTRGEETPRGLTELILHRLERECGQSETGRSADDEDCRILAVTALRGNPVVALLGARMGRERQLEAKASELQEGLVALAPGLFGMLGPQFSSLSEIPVLWEREVLPKQELAFYLKEGTLLTEAEPAGRPSRFDFAGYSRLLEGRRFAEAITLLKGYLEEAGSCRMDSFGLKNQAKNLIYTFLDYVPQSDEFRQESFRRINEAASYEAFAGYMEEFYGKLAELTGRDENAPDEKMERILAYLEEHYREELGLEQVADRFHYSYSYLSNCFKEQMHMGFVDYLNRLRIEKACTLLSTTDLSVAQISEAVGYSEHSYFCRVFKKLTGRTPSNWRG